MYLYLNIFAHTLQNKDVYYGKEKKERIYFA